MSNLDRNSMVALSNYGRAMKFYAIAKLIWTCFSFILIFALQSSIMDLLNLTESEMMENAGSILLLILFVVVGGIGGGIFLIIRYLIYVFKLNKASKSPIGIALKTNLIIEFLLLATYVIASFLIIPLIIICNLVTITLLIAAAFYLGKWASSLSNYDVEENKTNQMLSSIRIMKIGLFVKLGVFLRLFASSPTTVSVGFIISYVGDIILVVGMLKTANEILSIFNLGQTEYGIALRNRSPVQRPLPEIGQNPMQSNNSTVKSPEPNGVCPYCGSSSPDPNSMFCSVCGKKIT